jgi:hypothetical protein
MTDQKIIDSVNISLASDTPLDRRKILKGLFLLYERSEPSSYAENGDRYWEKQGMRNACSAIIALITTGKCDVK